MLSIERTKSLIGNPHITDEEAETVRDSMRSLVEIIFEQWNEDKNYNKEKKNDTGITR